MWQQRQRANQLLQVASEYGSFPVVLEAMRECLQDVFDVPGLVGLMRDVASRSVRVVEVETPAASPFARSLLFGYVGMFLYEADAPLAERRAQALSLDSALLAELLGSADLRELLDADSIDAVELELQRLAEHRRATGLDAIHDLLRNIGDLSTAETISRGATAVELAELEASRRAIRVRLAGEQRWVAIEDAGRLRDALGTALPVGVPEAFTEPVRDPVGDLVARYARTHGPFHSEDLASRLGLGVAVVAITLERLRASGQVMQGEFRPAGQGTEWCDAEVLRAIRRRSLAALRKEVQPVPAETLARFLPSWQGVGARSSARHVEGLMGVIEQLAGSPLPASALETLVLPSRVADYSPALLDELTLAGEVLWCGAGALAGNDGWVVLAPADTADVILPLVLDPPSDQLHEALLATVTGEQALFFRSIAEAVEADVASVVSAIWDLVWAGLLTNDTIAPLRSLLAASTRTAHSRRPRTPRARYGRYSGLSPAGGVRPSGRATGPPTMAGRWSRLPARDTDPTRRALATAELLLDRYGIVTRGSVVAEGVPGGFGAVYPVLRAAEESGRARRGYFVEGLGAAQFALPGAVDRLRALDRSEPGARADPAQREHALVLAATDPANPFGASLPWPAQPARPADAPAEGPRRRGHQPARKAGALVVLVDGNCALYVERGGRTLLSFTDEVAALQPAADALALAVRDGALGRLSVERADGSPIASSSLGDALEAAGFRPTPRGLRLRG